MQKSNCTGIFDHSLEMLDTVAMDSQTITKQCPKCGFSEVLKRSNRNVLFVNNLVLQKKKWAADDTTKELIQPMTPKGEVNEEFTEAFGFNPFDKRTELATPTIQGGKA